MDRIPRLPRIPAGPRKGERGHVSSHFAPIRVTALVAVTAFVPHASPALAQDDSRAEIAVLPGGTTRSIPRPAASNGTGSWTTTG